MTSFILSKLDSVHIDEISAANNEPTWLKDYRKNSFAIYKELNPEAIETTWLGVLPDFHNQKVGSLLMEKSLKEMAKRYKVCEVKTLSEINPDPGYARTRNFYKKLGFIPLETIHPYPDWGDGSPCQIFVKWLRN